MINIKIFHDLSKIIEKTNRLPLDVQTAAIESAMALDEHFKTINPLSEMTIENNENKTSIYIENINNTDEVVENSKNLFIDNFKQSFENLRRY
jgi:hypothetical protein